MYIVSACLLGANCKYNGGNNDNEAVKDFCEGHKVIVLCPETAGGLTAPRPPAEQVRCPAEGKDGECDIRVINKNGEDLTEAFRKGAEACLRKVLDSGEEPELAILKANSPSCGCGRIYDGTFTGKLTGGDGVFAGMLKTHGIEVITEETLKRKSMIDIREKITDILAGQVEGLEKEEIRDMIEVPQDKSNGDYAFPCFKLARTLHKAPPLIAKDIAAGIESEALFEKVEQVNAYVNMFISRNEMSEITLDAALQPDFGRSDEGSGKTVLVEYSSPNIAKPFHIGHIRTTIIGDSLYRLYDELGYTVIRLNHLGDYGTQFGKMIVAYKKWGNAEELEKDPIKYLLYLYTKFHKEAENDPTLDDQAREAFVKLEAGEEEEVKLWKWFSDLSLKEFNRVYDMLGIKFDEYDGESFYSDKMQRFIDELGDKGLMHESRGANVVDLEDYGLGTALITKSDGSTLYCTRDIATAVYRKEHYGFYKNIYVVATQQNLYFKQLKKILELLGYEWQEDCIHVPFGMVSLENGQILSTRGGNVVFLEDVLNNAIDKTREIIREKNPDASDEFVDEIAKEVGIGAVKFQELSNNRIKDYTFTWDKVLNFDGETGPYVQYTHARCASVLRKAGDETVAKAQKVDTLDMSYISGENAYELVKLIYAFPEVVRDAAYKYEPSIVTRHIIDIAQTYNRFYHDEHILTDNEDEKLAKVALTIAAKNVLKTGLGLLGIAAPDRM